MKTRSLLQRPGDPSSQTIRAEMERRLAELPCRAVYVAMAYVSISGARTLWDAYSRAPNVRSQWLVGLDDYVTQPGALDLIQTLDGAELRIASVSRQRLRFHPKVCRFEAVSNREMLMVGSANLTTSGLSGNAEAVSFLESESPADKSQIQELWKGLWALGHKPTVDELTAYREQYKTAKPMRERLRALAAKEPPPREPSRGMVLARDTVELDPQNATICWIECGAVTAVGRELEFKAEQGLFFGLNPHVTTQKSFRFRVSSGKTIPLRLKYQGNHMWRLQMNNEVPEVERGLRPKLPGGRLGRSEFVAVVERIPNDTAFDLRFVSLQSQEFAKLRRRSADLGTVGHTTTTSAGRVYGWC